jgi:hypothetical protein
MEKVDLAYRVRNRRCKSIIEHGVSPKEAAWEPEKQVDGCLSCDDSFRGIRHHIIDKIEFWRLTSGESLKRLVTTAFAGMVIRKDIVDGWGAQSV